MNWGGRGTLTQIGVSKRERERADAQGLMEGKSGGHLLHDLCGVLHVEFPETIPDDSAMFIFPNLNVSASTGGMFFGKQVEKVFIVDFYEGALDTKIPSTSSLLAELPCTSKDDGYSSWDDTHTVLGISGVCIEVDTGHCMRFSGTGLSVGEDGTVKALQKP